MKKIISIFLIMLIIFTFTTFLLPSEVSATTQDNYFYSYSIPDKYDVLTSDVDDNSCYNSYYLYGKNYPTTISFYAFMYGENTYFTPYTQDDLNSRISILRNVYDEGRSETFTIESQEMFYLNNVYGYRIRYSVAYNNTSGKKYGHDLIELRSDRTSYTIQVDSSWDFINSSEERNIINSFKIKDTVLKTNGIPFTDVNKTDWFYNSVKYTYEHNMITGLNQYTFGPYRKLSRAMLVTILWRMESAPMISTNRFSDIKTSDWYAPAVNWAANNYIVSGYASGKFGPNDDITREQLCAILMNYSRYKKVDITKRADITKFRDWEKTQSYFRDAVSWCLASNIISGKENGTILDPRGTATRSEVAAMITNYCYNVKER